MKMKNFLLVNLVFAAFMIGSTKANAQTTIKVGPQLAYGTDIDNLGIGAVAEFGITEEISIAPDLLYYLPKKSGPVTANYFEINGNVNYYFFSNENMSVYGQGGLNYTNAKVKVKSGFMDDYIEASSSQGKIGFNLGAGINLNIINDDILPFANLKYVLSNFDHLVIAAGVKFRI